MKILGIDPGTSLIGWGVVEDLKAVDFGVCRTQSNIHNRDRVADVYDFFAKLIKKHRPDVVALETLFFFKNAKTVMHVSEVRGVLLLVAAHHGVEVREFTPLQVKQAISGYGRADKAQVQSMVKLVLGLKETPKPDDVADALALAICCANTVRYAT
mgnify:FL=1